MDRRRHWITRGWMPLLAAFWLFRFWMLRGETFWLLGLDVYRGNETVELATVSSARDGLLHLVAGIIMLFTFVSLTIRNEKAQPDSKESNNHKEGTAE